MGIKTIAVGSGLTGKFRPGNVLRSFHDGGSVVSDSFTPNSITGLVATIDPGVARTQSKIWQDAGKTTLATADGDTVRAIQCPYTGANWTTPGNAFTLKLVNGQWRLRAAGGARFLLSQTIDLSNCFTANQFLMTIFADDCQLNASIITGGNYYGVNSITDGPTPKDKFATFSASPGQNVSHQGTKLSTMYNWLKSINGSSSFTEVNGVRTFEYTDGGTSVTGWTVAGVSGFDIYSLNGDLGFHAIYTSQPNTAERTSLTNYMYSSAVLTVPTKLLVSHGNSLTVGYGQTQGTSWPVQALASLGSTYTPLQWGISGIQTPTMITDQPSILTLINKALFTFSRKICVVWEGINHLNTGAATAQQAHDSLQSLCQLWTDAGYDVVLMDVAKANPSSPSTGFLTRLAATNTLLAADFTVATGDPVVWTPVATTYAKVLVKLSAVTNLQDPSNTTYFNADQVHLTAAGATEVSTAAVSGIGALP